MPKISMENIFKYYRISLKKTKTVMPWHEMENDVSYFNIEQGDNFDTLI